MKSAFESMLNRMLEKTLKKPRLHNKMLQKFSPFFFEFNHASFVWILKEKPKNPISHYENLSFPPIKDIPITLRAHYYLLAQSLKNNSHIHELTQKRLKEEMPHQIMLNQSPHQNLLLHPDVMERSQKRFELESKKTQELITTHLEQIEKIEKSYEKYPIPNQKKIDTISSIRDSLTPDLSVEKRNSIANIEHNLQLNPLKEAVKELSAIKLEKIKKEEIIKLRNEIKEKIVIDLEDSKQLQCYQKIKTEIVIASIGENHTTLTADFCTTEFCSQHYDTMLKEVYDPNPNDKEENEKWRNSFSNLLQTYNIRQKNPLTTAQQQFIEKLKKLEHQKKFIKEFLDLAKKHPTQLDWFLKLEFIRKSSEPFLDFAVYQHYLKNNKNAISEISSQNTIMLNQILIQTTAQVVRAIKESDLEDKIPKKAFLTHHQELLNPPPTPEKRQKIEQKALKKVVKQISETKDACTTENLTLLFSEATRVNGKKSTKLLDKISLDEGLGDKSSYKSLYASSPPDVLQLPIETVIPSMS